MVITVNLHKIEIITEKLKMINFERDANKTRSGSFQRIIEAEAEETEGGDTEEH